MPGVFEGLNKEAVAFIYALNEIVCRPSEIANLMPEDICLDANVPYIRIRPSREREIKTRYSIRDIPLLGVSLEALRLCPDSFPHYRDCNDLLFQSLMKAFKVRRSVSNAQTSDLFLPAFLRKAHVGGRSRLWLPQYIHGPPQHPAVLWRWRIHGIPPGENAQNRAPLSNRPLLKSDPKNTVSRWLKPCRYRRTTAAPVSFARTSPL